MPVNYNLRPRKQPKKSNKVCIYCGHFAESVASASVNCPSCKKRGLRKAFDNNEVADADKEE